MNLLDTNQDDQIQIPSDQDPLELLTAPGGKFDRSKYASEQDMYKAIAKGKVEGDLYIDHFKQRHDELREDYKKLRDEYNAGPSLKELIDQFKAAKESNNDNTQIVDKDKSDTLSKEDYQRLVQQEIARNRQQELEEQNYNTVQAKLIEEYGPNYATTLKQQISSLKLTPDFVNDLARKHPQVLFRTLGLDGQRRSEVFQAPPQSTNRSDPFAPNAPKRTWSYYQKIRQTDPTRYRDPKLQDQMFKDAASLGEAFQDGDWNQLGH